MTCRSAVLLYLLQSFPILAHSCFTVIALQLPDYTASHHMPVQSDSRMAPKAKDQSLIQPWMGSTVADEQQEQGSRGARGALLRHSMAVTASRVRTISREGCHECQIPPIAFIARLRQQRLSVGPSSPA